MSSPRREVAWVTGGRRGIGAAIAERLRGDGLQVFVTDVSESDGVDACDVCDPGALEGYASQVIERAGRLDVLVNNAGIQLRKSFVDLLPNEYDRVIDTNVKGPFFASLAVARTMIASKIRGRIINVCSVNADRARPDTAFYCASKGAVRAMTRAMAIALGPHGIRVNSVDPGTVATDLNRDRLSDPVAVRENVRRIALGRLGMPDDIAPAVAFLASSDAAFITGATIGIHGGWSLSG